MDEGRFESVQGLLVVFSLVHLLALGGPAAEPVLCVHPNTGSPRLRNHKRQV
jgi:hypothetical protein